MNERLLELLVRDVETALRELTIAVQSRNDMMRDAAAERWHAATQALRRALEVV